MLNTDPVNISITTTDNNAQPEWTAVPPSQISAANGPGKLLMPCRKLDLMFESSHQHHGGKKKKRKKNSTRELQGLIAGVLREKKSSSQGRCFQGLKGS